MNDGKNYENDTQVVHGLQLSDSSKCYTIIMTTLEHVLRIETKLKSEQFVSQRLKWEFKTLSPKIELYLHYCKNGFPMVVMCPPPFYLHVVYLIVQFLVLNDF